MIVVFLQVVLYVVAALFLISGFGSLIMASTIMHEIHAALLLGFGCLILAAQLIAHAVRSTRAPP